MNLMPIIDFIERETDLRKAKDLFNYSMPSKVSKGVMVVIDAGQGQIDYEVPGRHRARFQVIVRNPDYDEAIKRANEIFTLLWSEVRRDFGDYVVDFIRPVHKPIPYRRLDGDEIEVSVNYDALYHDVA